MLPAGWVVVCAAVGVAAGKVVIRRSPAKVAFSAAKDTLGASAAVVAASLVGLEPGSATRLLAAGDWGIVALGLACGIWRLNVAAGQQGKGYGRYAVEAVCDEARRRGQRRVTVLWKPGEHGPEGFYLRLGFRTTGQRFHDQLVGERFLD